MNPPVSHHPGDHLCTTIESIAYGGDGVARVDGFVVFVPFTAVGEEVEIELVEVKKSFARGRVVHVMRRSPDRVEPPCRYFGNCGGCQYQHLRYEAQLQLKRVQIQEVLERLGGLTDLAVDPVLPCPAPFGYRNRIMVRSQWDRTIQSLRIGFIRTDNRFVVDVEECLIAEPALNERLREVRRNPPPKGGIKVTLRLPPENWEVPPDSFFQNNYHALPTLVALVRERLRESGVRFLIDAYCGVGFFGVECADLVERFTGVEIDRTAIKAARRNLERRGISTGDFVAGSAEEWIPAILQRFPAGQTAVVTDPPRTGCAPEFIQSLRESPLRQVLYISCHPATLARDLKALCEGNIYRIARVTPLDMLPQTQHVECVVDLRRVDEGADSNG
jgi:tRNA/tmRNA/rRNA uracil-C5-methylase (TrmA/RlmC/RlmD family)